MGSPTRPSPLRVAIAFACIYLIWGSTYLAIRFAIETVPPLLMAGIRFLVAGAILYGWCALRGEAERPSGAQWGAAALLGGLFFLGGNGGVAIAETRISSGLTALLIGAIPIWIVLLDWIRPRGARPNGVTVIGTLVAFAGVWLLVDRRAAPGGPAVDPLSVSVLVVGTLAWATGTIASSRLPHVRSHLQSGGMQMLAGGALLCVAGIAIGEGPRLHAAAVSARSWLSIAYLVVAGSLIAFSAYNWLLRVTTPARVGTYAFVNPAIAVFLGWALGGEAVGPGMMLAGALILAGVVLIILTRTATAPVRTPSPERAPANFPPTNPGPRGRG